MSTEEILSDLKREAFSGDLVNASTEKLNGYAAALCHSQAFSAFGNHEFPQICETVRIHLLRAHIENLQQHITTLDAKNTKLSWLVVGLTIASLIGTGIQSTIAIRSEARAESQDMRTEKAPQAQQLPASAPTPAIPPSTHPVESKEVDAKPRKQRPDHDV